MCGWGKSLIQSAGSLFITLSFLVLLPPLFFAFFISMYNFFFRSAAAEILFWKEMAHRFLLRRIKWALQKNDMTLGKFDHLTYKKSTKHDAAMGKKAWGEVEFLARAAASLFPGFQHIRLAMIRTHYPWTYPYKPASCACISFVVDSWLVVKERALNQWSWLMIPETN